MKYLAAIYIDEQGGGRDPDEGRATMAAYDAFGREATEAGVLVTGDGLEPTSTATTVRVRDGERFLTDGPFAETKEQLAGFYIFECKDLDEAIGWAARIPGAKTGSVEVRPVMDYEARRQQAASAAQA
jgi:hypothetical protein